MAMKPTRADLARMFPRARPGWIDALATLAPQLCEFYDVGRLEWCHICGQIAAETAGLSIDKMVENMRFTSTRRILEVYGYRLGVAIQAGPVFGRRYRSKAELARALVDQPEMLADVVYGGPHGREGTPPWQGSRYLGRGPLQTTHLNNYRAARDEIRKQPGGEACPDLVEHPETLSTDPEMGVRAVFAEWKIKGLKRWALADNCYTLSDILNTGNDKDAIKPWGMERRVRETARAKAIWPDTPKNRRGSPEAAIPALVVGSRGPDVIAAQELLRAQGYAVGAVDGVFGQLTARAVAAFQHEHSLAVDGDLDAHDMEVLRSTAPADLGERATATSVPGSDQQAAGKVIETTGQTLITGSVAEAVGQKVFDVSPMHLGMEYLDSAVSAVGKVSAVGVTIDPRIGGIILATIGGVVLWKWGSKLKIGRLIKYRLGLDLSK